VNDDVAVVGVVGYGVFGFDDDRNLFRSNGSVEGVCAEMGACSVLLL